MLNKKIKNATESIVDGIATKSKLEVMVYNTLKNANLNPQYEPDTFVLMRGFKPEVPYYTKDKKSKNLTSKTKKVIDWRYTPDFKVVAGDWTFYIEAKGIENDVYPYKRKMFLKILENYRRTAFIEVWTKQHVLDAIEIIKSYEKDSRVTQDSP